MRPRTLKSASEAGNTDAVLYHLGNGAKINATTAAGHFPLGGAVINGRLSVVSLLIQKGANVNLKSEYGWTPLYLAAWKGHAKIAKILIAAGARLNIRTLSGYNSPDRHTPLHIAACYGHADVVRVLVKHGAILNALTGDDETAVDLALESGEKKIATFLANHGGKQGRKSTGSQ